MSVRHLGMWSVLAIALAFAVGAPRGATAADTRTWTGGDPANANWTDPDNWDTGAPVAGDSLVFPQGAARKGNTNNFPDGTAFQDITFTGEGYEIDGNHIALTGTLTNSAPGGTNVLDLSIDGLGLVSVASGRLAFTAPNDYNGNTFVLSGATLLLSGAGSAGNTSGATTVSNGGRLQLANNVDLGDETLLVVGGGPGGLGSLQSLSGTNRVEKIGFNGDVVIAVGQSTLILTHVAQAAGGFTLIGGGKLQIEGMVSGSPTVVAEDGNLTWNATNGPAILVKKDGWLRGTGTVAGITSNGGLLWPGSGSDPGILTTTGATTLTGGAFRVDLDGPVVGTGYGRLMANGPVTIAASLTQLQLELGVQPVPGQSFTIIRANSPIQGTFLDLPEGTVFERGGFAFSITYKGGMSGSDVVLTVLRQVAADLAAGISVVPETATPGQLLTYTLTMRNDGPDAAISPRFSFGIPAGTTFESVHATGWTCSTPPSTNPPSVGCVGPTLASGATATIMVVVRVNPGATGNVSATVSTFATTNDPLSADNSATVVVPVGPAGPGSPLPFRRFLPGISRD